MRSYGTASLANGEWVLDMEPHVALRVKRLFGRAASGRRGRLVIKSTPETCRDLEWVMQRYPLEVSDPEVLDGGARRFDARGELVEEIISGRYKAKAVEMALPPRPYQSAAADLVLSSGGLLVADELGLGKTATSLTVMAHPGTLPALVVCYPHLQAQWEREVRKFLPRLRTHVIQRSDPYPLPGAGDADGLPGLEPEPDILISTYTKLSGWSRHLAGHVTTVVFDECQELRRHESQKYKAASHIAEMAQYRIGLSATPIYNYGLEFWNVLNVLAPDQLGSESEFLREWCVHSEEKRKARIRDPRAFGSYVRDTGIMLRRTRKQVGGELPAVNRVVQSVPCDTSRLEGVAKTATDLANVILGQGAGWEKLKAGGEFDMLLRQATGIGKAPYVAEFIRMMLETDEEPVLVFAWHRMVYDLLAERLEAFKPAFYTGSETPVQKEREKDRFLSGDARVMFVSLRSGAGLDGLQEACSRLVFAELDWSPGAMEQCIGRLHRDGQKDPVFAYYLTADDGTDPTMIDVLGVKKAQVDGVREPQGGVLELREVDPDHLKKLAKDFLRRHR